MKLTPQHHKAIENLAMGLNNKSVAEKLEIVGKVRTVNVGRVISQPDSIELTEDTASELADSIASPTDQ